MNFDYIKTWYQDFKAIFARELKMIFSDSGVMLIFFVAGLLYPLLYSYIYSNGLYDDMPVAVVDNADCSASRRFIREVDATREVAITYKCTDMAEAKRLLESRKVKGIMMFPSDYGKCMESGQTATLSLYCDMSSFFYYKNLLLGANHVMLQEMSDIQLMRYTNSGLTEQEAVQLVQGLPYEENNPYNPSFAYNIFLLSVILFVIIQQTMFYGMTLLNGTMMERRKSFADIPGIDKKRGALRSIFARGAAYILVYTAIGLYVSFIVPSIFQIVPQRGNFLQIACMTLIFVIDCAAFSLVWSSFVRRRESVFLLFLFMSPVCLFLTGTSWPTWAMPDFWKVFSWIFPTTFGCQAFVNMNTAGGSLASAESQIVAMLIQTAVYFVVAAMISYWKASRRNTEDQTAPSCRD